jgi:hypothetical protein
MYPNTFEKQPEQAHVEINMTIPSTTYSQKDEKFFKNEDHLENNALRREIKLASMRNAEL